MILSHFVLYIAHDQFNHPHVQNDFTSLGTVKHNHSQAGTSINAPQTTHITYLSLYLPPTLLFPNSLSLFPRFICSIFFPLAKHDFLINVHLLPELTLQWTMSTLHWYLVIHTLPQPWWPSITQQALKTANSPIKFMSLGRPNFPRCTSQGFNAIVPLRHG